MRLFFRILIVLHILLVGYGLFGYLIQNEYIISSKFVFIGIIGAVLFLNAQTQISSTHNLKKTLALSSVGLYLFTMPGLFFPVIFKNYWNLILGLTILLLLISLYTFSLKSYSFQKLDYLFFATSILATSPFIFLWNNQIIVVFSGIILAILTGIILVRFFRFQSK